MTEYVAIATGVYTVASIITRLTPTTKDDKVVAKIGSIWKLLFDVTRSK